jgi:ribosomal protein L30/L7E
MWIRALGLGKREAHVIYKVSTSNLQVLRLVK